MTTRKQTTVGGPKCPNHHCALLSTGDRHKWQCPISDAIFEVKVDEQDQEETNDKFGNQQIVYTIKGAD